MTWEALRDVVSITLTSAVVLAALVFAGRRGWTPWLVPTPGQTVQQFLTGIEARSASLVRGQMSRALQEKVSPEIVARYAEGWEAAGDAILETDEEADRIRDDRAESVVKVKWKKRGEETRRFQLSREAGLWKINSLGGLP